MPASDASRRVFSGSRPASATSSNPGWRENATAWTRRPNDVPINATRNRFMRLPRVLSSPASNRWPSRARAKISIQGRPFMRDPRNARLARVIVEHSTQLQAGEAMLIEAFDLQNGLVLDLVDAVHDVGGHPIVALRSNTVLRSLISRGTARQFEIHAAIDLAMMKEVQAYAGIRASHNATELADVPSDRMGLYSRLVSRPVHLDYRVNHTRWVVLRYPTASMAQMANMTTEAFEDFYYRVCTLDYSRMSDAIRPLKERMEKTDRVEIRGPGTDLRFSIRGIGVVPCEGRRNLPDGECFTAPVRDSVEGTLCYNTPSLYLGTTFENLAFTFEGGKIV